MVLGTQASPPRSMAAHPAYAAVEELIEIRAPQPVVPAKKFSPPNQITFRLTSPHVRG